MISRETLLSTLNNMKTEDNAYVVDRYIATVEGLNDEALQVELEKKRIRNVRQVKHFISKEAKTKRHNFIGVNDLISYGITGDTLHIHVVPTDLHDKLGPRKVREEELKLIQALEELRIKLQADEEFKNIKEIYAGSPIMTKPISTMFERLQFDVKSMGFAEAKKDPDLKWLCKRFKNKTYKYMGRAKLPREIFLSEDWQKVANSRKEELQKRLKNNFTQFLEEQTNTEVTEQEARMISETETQNKQGVEKTKIEKVNIKQLQI